MEATTESSAMLFGYLGAASSLVFASAGAAYGTMKSAQGMSLAEEKGNPISAKFMIPVIISGVLAIYGLIYSVIALASIVPGYSTGQGYATLGAGLGVGLCCLLSGLATGKVSRSGIPHAAENPKSFVRFVLTLVYCEAIGLYGLIFALIAQNSLW